MSTIKDFLIMEKLGEGSFSTVYKVRLYLSSNILIKNIF